MDNINEFISSGIIEMFCMGLTNEAETAEVVRIALLHKEVRDEILQVTESLSRYAVTFRRTPSHDLRSKILDSFSEEKSDIQLPVRLYNNISIAYWKQYLKEKAIAPPANYDPFFLAELPSDEKQVTYAVWAKKGASLEETHDSEEEWLFVLNGTCTMTINGRVSHHKAGDLISIPANVIHKAEATADDMVLIGQRIAA